jgi:undecaprenyl-diphosphatase
VKPVWIAVAVVVVAFLVVRRRRLESTTLAGGAVVAAAALVYGLGLIHFPNLEQLLIDIGTRLGKWTYLLVGALAFLETGAFIGLVAPGETALLLGGLVAGQGRIDVLTMIAIVWAAAVAGDLTSFFLGRRLGRSFMVEHGARVKITEERLRQVEDFFDRHGGKAILIGRFVGLVRAIAPFLAGSSGMAMRRFLPYDVVGAGLWGSSLVLLGYIFWQSFSRLLDYAKKGALALAAVIVLVTGIVWAVRWLRDEDNRRRLRAWVDRQAERPALRPLARVLAPLLRTTRGPARFVWDRVTPGDLGLELTTVLAVAGVGAFVFVWDLVGVQERSLLAGDRMALHLADRLHADAAVSAAKVVTVLGSLPVAIGLVALAGTALVWQRAIRDAVALVLGLALTYAAVHIAKDAVDRPRPAGALVDSRFALMTVAIVIAIVVGLTRIYLRAHYLSDVVGGWGLGAAVFGLCGVVALVIGYVRNNARAHA